MTSATKNKAVGILCLATVIWTLGAATGFTVGVYRANAHHHQAAALIENQRDRSAQWHRSADPQALIAIIRTNLNVDPSVNTAAISCALLANLPPSDIPANARAELTRKIAADTLIAAAIDPDPTPFQLLMGTAYPYAIEAEIRQASGSAAYAQSLYEFAVSRHAATPYQNVLKVDAMLERAPLLTRSSKTP